MLNGGGFFFFGLKAYYNLAQGKVLKRQRPGVGSNKINPTPCKGNIKWIKPMLPFQGTDLFNPIFPKTSPFFPRRRHYMALPLG